MSVAKATPRADIRDEVLVMLRPLRLTLYEVNLCHHRGHLDEFYRVAFRKKIYGSIAELQGDLDSWVQSYNEERPHQGRWCFGKTPLQTFLDATPLAKEKLIAA